jgi:hypothetical protein
MTDRPGSNRVANPPPDVSNAVGRRISGFPRQALRRFADGQKRKVPVYERRFRATAVTCRRTFAVTHSARARMPFVHVYGVTAFNGAYNANRWSAQQLENCGRIIGDVQEPRRCRITAENRFFARRVIVLLVPANDDCVASRRRVRHVYGKRTLGRDSSRVPKPRR